MNSSSYVQSVTNKPEQPKASMTTQTQSCMNSPVESYNDNEVSHRLSLPARLLQIVLLICFWLGNLVIAAPLIAERLAAKAAPLIGALSGSSSPMTPAPEWLVIAMAAMIATQVVAITLIMGFLDMRNGPAPEADDEPEEQRCRDWRGLLERHARPSLIWVLVLNLAYYSLYQNERAWEGNAARVDQSEEAVVDGLDLHPGEPLFTNSLSDLQEVTATKQGPDFRLSELLPSPDALSYWLLAFLSVSVLVSQFAAGSHSKDDEVSKAQKAL
jgi:hypothetical protein